LARIQNRTGHRNGIALRCCRNGIGPVNLRRLKVQGSGFKVQGFRVQGSRVQGSRFKGSGFKVQGFRVPGSGFSAAAGREHQVKSKKKLMNIEH
jgi:hypothetical protein